MRANSIIAEYLRTGSLSASLAGRRSERVLRDVMKELRFSRKEAVGCRDSWIAMPVVLSKVTAARVNFGKGAPK